MCCDIIIGKNIYNHNQRFDMNFKIIKSTGCTEYNAAADLYEISFPEHEQRRNESLTGKTRAKSEPIFQGQTTWEVTRVAKWGRL